MGDKLTCCSFFTACCPSTALQQPILQARPSLAAALTAAAPAGVSPPAMAGTVAEQDIHWWVHSHWTKMSWPPSLAMSASAHLAVRTALGCWCTSGAWRALQSSLPVPGCGWVVGLCGFLLSRHGRQAHMPSCGATTPPRLEPKWIPPLAFHQSCVNWRCAASPM